MENAETECGALLKRLYLYLDGEACGADCAEIESHLEDCVECLRQVGFEREIKLLVRRKCSAEDIPVDLAESIKLRLRGLV